MQEISMVENVLMQLPAQVSVLKGPNHIFKIVNPPAQQVIGNRDVIGKPVREAFPELEGQGFFELLDKVYTTREVFTHKSMPATIQVDGKDKQLYVDVTYLPLIGTDGEVEGVISFTYDVTEAVLAKMELQETANRLKAAYEDLEVKVKFRNIELEKKNVELQNKLNELTSG